MDAGRVRAANGYDPTHVSRIESGKRPATEVFAKLCDQVFPHRAGWFSEFYDESRTWIATPPWFRNYVSYEQLALTLRNWFPSLIDGLLQTEDYARKILAVGTGAAEDEVSARITTRDDAPSQWPVSMSGPCSAITISAATSRTPRPLPRNWSVTQSCTRARGRSVSNCCA